MHTEEMKLMGHMGPEVSCGLFSFPSRPDHTLLSLVILHSLVTRKMSLFSPPFTWKCIQLSLNGNGKLLLGPSGCGVLSLSWPLRAPGCVDAEGRLIQVQLYSPHPETDHAALAVHSQL
jgi:hypothetical protein